MIRVRIGTEEQPIDTATPDWVKQQFDRQGSGNRPVCVQVTIKVAGMDIFLSTPNCARGGGGRRPNGDER